MFFCGNSINSFAYLKKSIRDDIILADVQPIARPASILPPVLSMVSGYNNQVEMPDVRGFSMRKAMTTLRSSGIKFKIEGSGKVAWQSPRPGTILHRGKTCVVHLK